eukprot:CAMPEP_0178460338 /NCGR_PEP_ID=MMETSP0689_2-20121128/48644_1 /TAXON_ID=160604 /ORGANISM="Amphidinium massartii, Strain CS-259" /LENGTH=61 /DNA_ID=CAMNT_0020086943 /DNA_START=1 /DNA_END=182 /DNA_ORIENTATION=+
MKLDSSELASYLANNWQDVQDWNEFLKHCEQSAPHVLDQLKEGQTCVHCLEPVGEDDLICR